MIIPRKAALRDRFVKTFLRAFGRRALAAYQKARAGKPDLRCRTCAFREIEKCGVDGWKGWSASLGLMVLAIERGKPFLCHRSRMVKGAYIPHRRPRFCAGYAALAGPSVQRVLCEAAIDVEVGP